MHEIKKYIIVVAALFNTSFHAMHDYKKLASAGLVTAGTTYYLYSKWSAKKAQEEQKKNDQESKKLNQLLNTKKILSIIKNKLNIII